MIFGLLAAKLKCHKIFIKDYNITLSYKSLHYGKSSSTKVKIKSLPLLRLDCNHNSKLPYTSKTAKPTFLKNNNISHVLLKTLQFERHHHDNQTVCIFALF